MYSETTEGPTPRIVWKFVLNIFLVFETALFQINTNFTVQFNILGI